MTPPVWSTLLWLDWHLLRNRVRAILRTPRRLVPWALFAALLIPSLGARLASAAGAPPAARQLTPMLPLLARGVPGAILTILGLLVWRASVSAPAAFQSAADARYVIGGGLTPRTVMAWLAFRSMRRLAMATGFYLLVLALYLPAIAVPLGDALGTVVGIAFLLALLFGTRIMVFTAATRHRWARLDLVGVAIALAGVGALCVSLSPLSRSAARVLEALPPGGWLLGAAHDDTLSMGLLAGTAVLAIAAGILLADDCLPELWHASTRTFVMSGRRRSTRHGPASDVRSASGRFIPKGAAALIWKEWLSFRRGQGIPMLQLGAMVGAIVLGIVVGLVCSMLDGAVAFAVGYAAVAFAMLSNLGLVRLGRELRTPIWWLGADPLWMRLGVVSLARGVRWSAPLIAFSGLVLTLGGEPLWEAPLTMVAEIVFSWLQQTLGIAFYTFLPSPRDIRAVQVLRMLCLCVALVPISLALLPGALLNNSALMLLAAIVLMLAELALLLALASRRLEGNGIGVAAEERS